MSQISASLQKLFDQHRVIFWYDPDQGLQEEYELLQLKDVNKHLVQNNEFVLKHQILEADPEGWHLLFFPYPEPAYMDNWLLDLQLAHKVFHTDQASMYIQEMGLDQSLKPLVDNHLEFFKAKERRDRWTALLHPRDREGALQRKMMAVVLGSSDASIEALVRQRIAAWNEENRLTERDFIRFELEAPFWKEVQRHYQYTADQPIIYDLVLYLFKTLFPPGKEDAAEIEIRLLFSGWKEHVHGREVFRRVSQRVALDLQISDRLDKLDREQLLEDDLFEVIEQKIIHDLASRLAKEEASVAETEEIIRRRRERFWYAAYEDMYQALSRAAALLQLVKTAVLPANVSLIEGASLYAHELSRVDYHYRKFTTHYRLAAQNTVLSGVYQRVNLVYTNQWLNTVSNTWQDIINKADGWLPPSDARHQFGFFKHKVKPIIDRPQRLFVVISDALRYECAQELHEILQAEKRFTSELDFLVTGLPSYTQLGMAGLLPHEKLEIRQNDLSVQADQRSTIGLEARKQVLDGLVDIRATAILAKDLLAMPSSPEGRAFAKEYDLIYVYHNQIDKVGDDSTTEDKVFDAVEDELETLVKILKKIANINGTQILLTADHGFLYQNEPLEESSFSEPSFSGEVWKKNRRFVVGRNLGSHQALTMFQGQQLGLQDDVEVLIPKGMQRLRIQGAGSKYVHGGATLQEVVIPVLHISRERTDTTSTVDIDIIQSSDRITTNVLAVTFLQKQSIDESLLSRRMRAMLTGAHGEQLSDIFTHTFDMSGSSERQRTIRHTFTLSPTASASHNNQRIRLLLEEPVEGSNQWKTYKTFHYTLNISFNRDFDE